MIQVGTGEVSFTMNRQAALDFAREYHLPYTVWQAGQGVMRIDTKTNERGVPDTRWRVYKTYRVENNVQVEAGITGFVVKDEPGVFVTLYFFTLNSETQLRNVAVIKNIKDLFKETKNESTLDFAERFDVSSPNATRIPLEQVNAGLKSYGDDWNLIVNQISGHSGTGLVDTQLKKPFEDAGFPGFRNMLTTLRVVGVHF